MRIGDYARKRLHILSFLFAVFAMLAVPQAGFAQEPAAAQVSADATAADATAPAEASTDGYTPLGPDMIKGQPHPGAITFQKQYSPNGEYALWMHDAVLLPIITAIVIFVLILLLVVMARYNKRANPVASKTSHNTLLEVLWTGIPVLILVVIAVPSLLLLSKQYESPPEDAVTVKVTGYQWYWGYEYPDHGVGEFVSNMMSEEEAHAKGFPAHLEVDNRMVVPVGVPIRVQVIGADVIHSFAVPSLWFKIDAVPGKLNERTMQVDEPGIYYGQCSELCGARHGYMPIAVEAVPMERFQQWVAAQGGAMPGAEAAVVEEAVAEEATADEAAAEVPAA